MSLSPTQLFAVLTPTQQLSATLQEAGPPGAEGPPGPQGEHGTPTTIADEGVALAEFDILNFIGSGVSAAVDAVNNRINVTIPGGGSQTPWTGNVDAAGYALGNVITVGIGVVAPSPAVSPLWVRALPGVRGTYTLRGAVSLNSTIANGTAPLAPSVPLLILGREGVPGLAYANFAEFALKRYENVGLSSRTQLDIALCHDVADDGLANNPVVLSLQSGGNLGLPTPHATYKLNVTGDVNTTGVYRINGVALAGQTPWTSDIDGAGFNLGGVNNLGFSATVGNKIYLYPAEYGFGLFGGELRLFTSATGKITFGGQTPSLVFTQSAYIDGATGDIGIGHSARTATISVPTDGAADSGAFVISTRSLGTLAERMRVTAAGNVGIGTPGPLAHLDVLVTSMPYDSALSGSSDIRFGVGGAVTTDALLLGVHTGDYSWIQATCPGVSSRNLLLQPNGGNVGIGTSAPETKLHLFTGGLVSTELRLSNGISHTILTQNADGATTLQNINGYSMRISLAGVTVMDLANAGQFTLPLLPSTNPGAGTKQLWYDAADSNRVKFAA